MLEAMGAGFAVEEIDIDDIITSLGNGLKGGHEYQTYHDDKGQDQSAVRFNHHFLASFLPRRNLGDYISTVNPSPGEELPLEKRRNSSILTGWA
ncbi:hypothetical protein [Coleofasciculus sp. E2-BRE-01]|uniref:hypothetical protein n=1 Tax=Coleofasciculus sp. E2-BRE-01 TaxID=3069524 RepID=UPI0032FFD434